MVTLNTLTVLVGETLTPETLSLLVPGERRIRLLDDRDVDEAAQAPRLLVVTPATRLGEFAPCISEANRHNRLQALLVRSDVEPEWVPFMLKRAGLRTLRNLLVHQEGAVSARVLQAWALGAEKQAITAATTFGDTLLVVSCALEEYEIGFDAYPALECISPEARSHFEVEPDGMFLHWPDADVHLTLDDVRMAADPAQRARAESLRRRHDVGFGAAVRALREGAGLPQTRIPGLTARHVRRIEGGSIPGDAAIQALAAAHGMDPDAYLDAVAERIAGS